MSRRVPLPRLTRRQRTSRWQRERRQQAIVVTGFTAVLVFVLGLVAWAASDRYYQANLAGAAEVQGRIVPQREYQQQYRMELVRLYVQYGVPAAFENDPQLAAAKSSYQDLALDRVVEHHVLEVLAPGAGISVSPQQVDQQYEVEYGEYRVRHILITVPKDADDADAAEATAQARARAITNQLREAPSDDELWKRIAEASSEDLGTQFTGGELGWASRGQYVQEFEDAIRTLGIGQVSDPIRTQFGYHVLQVEEKHAPADTDLVKRYLTSGFSVADLRVQARHAALKAQFQRRAQAESVTSPTEQVHLAKIVVNIPSLAGGDYGAFTEALQKQSTVRAALAEGTDFAEVAKAQSEDAETKDKGGDVGFVARGMITNPRAEAIVFSTEAGKTTDPISTQSDWTVYKVLEKTTRDLTAEQKTTIKLQAYDHWFQRAKIDLGVLKLIPGLALE